MHNEHITPNISEIPIKISPWHTHSKRRLSNLHYHDEIELLACQSGAVRAVIDNVSHLVRENEVLFINSRVPHETFCEIEGSKSMYIQFRADTFLQSTQTLSKYLSYLRRNTTRSAQIITDPIILNSMCAILSEHEQKQSGYANLIYANVHTICGMLTREKIFTSESQTDMQSLHKLLPSLAYIDENYSSELSLDDVSAVSGLNKYYFCRLFKKACGIGFSEYLNLVRVSKAEKMLRKTNKTVLEIAFDTGFSSVSYFNTIFRKYKGCTPTACRSAVNFNI